MERVYKYGTKEALHQVFIFGSFSRGQENPNDIDVLIVFESEKSILYDKKRYRELWNLFGGRLSKVDLLIRSTEDHDNNYSLVFKKEDLVHIWKKDDPDWLGKVQNKCPKPSIVPKHIQYGLFKSNFLLRQKIELAIERELITVKEIDSKPYYEDRGPWNTNDYYYDEDKRKYRKGIRNEYQIFSEYLESLMIQKVKQSYIDTLQIMYSYAFKAGIVLEQEYLKHIKGSSAYESYYMGIDEDQLILIYNPNLDSLIFHLLTKKELEKLILIPEYKRQSKTHYLYEIQRGSKWCEKNVEEFDKQNFHTIFENSIKNN